MSTKRKVNKYEKTSLGCEFSFSLGNALRLNANKAELDLRLFET